MCVCGTEPCARTENRVSLVLNVYVNGCLRAVTGIKRIENRVSLVLNDYGHGCLRAVIGIKIRDVRGLGEYTRTREYNCWHIYDKCVYVVQCHVQG